METRTYKVYLFKHLTNEVKEKALERYRLINVEDSFWYEPTLDEWKIKLASLGYDDAKIYFRGFGSQGDGACFEARIEMKNWLRAHSLVRKFNGLHAFSDFISCSLVHGGLYYHSQSTHVSYEVGYDTGFVHGELYKHMAKVEALILEERKSLGDKLYRKLEKIYYERTSDEAVKDTLITNEYFFTEDGKID